LLKAFSVVPLGNDQGLFEIYDTLHEVELSLIILKQLDYQKVNKCLERLEYQRGVFIEIVNTLEKTIIEFGHFKIN
jgi:hypothetical protein